MFFNAQSSEAEAKPLPMIAMSTWVMTCSLEQKRLCDARL